MSYKQNQIQHKKLGFDSDNSAQGLDSEQRNDFHYRILVFFGRI